MKKILTTLFVLLIAFITVVNPVIVEAASTSTKTSISKIESKAKGFKVTWIKKAKTSGYQIQYSTSSKFTN